MLYNHERVAIMMANRHTLLGFIVLGLLAGAVLAAAEDSDLRNELSSLRRQIQRVNTRLRTLDAERQPILAKLARLDLKVERERLGIRRIDLQQRRLETEIQANQKKQKRLRDELETERFRARKVVRYIYKLGGQSYLKLFLRVDSLEQLFRNYHLFMILIGRHLERIRIVRRKTDQLQEVTQELDGQESELDQRRQAHQEAIKRLEALKSDQKKAVARVNRDRNTHLRLLSELRARAGELEDLIHRSGTGDTSAPMRHLNALKGRLPWPLTGKVSSRFGRQRSTRFNTYILNDGIEIKPTSGLRVKAVYPGKVVFADYFKGYGNLLILQHAKNFHSLYGHCARFFKKRGDRVKKGEAIALAGDSGSTSGPSLYFAVRTKLKPRDPLRWLVRR